MRHNPFAPWPLLVMLLILAVGLPAYAVCTAGNPNASVIESTPISNFTVNGNSTVTHTKTGLMWKQCAEGLSGANCSSGAATPMIWANALKAANTANNAAFAGYTDWRLPNVKELESIVELCGYNPGDQPDGIFGYACVVLLVGLVVCPESFERVVRRLRQWRYRFQE